MPSGVTSMLLTEAMREPRLVMSRAWAMPSPDTFSVPPIGDFVKRWQRGVTADPFARNSQFATYRNDLNPETKAEYHMDAEDFLLHLGAEGIKLDCGIFDPPYSPRQISECYKSIGRDVTGAETKLAIPQQQTMAMG